MSEATPSPPSLLRKSTVRKEPKMKQATSKIRRQAISMFNGSRPKRGAEEIRADSLKRSGTSSAGILFGLPEEPQLDVSHDEANPRLVVVKARGCRACSEAVAALSEAMVPVAIVDLSVEPWRRKEIHELSGAFSVPQIFVDGRFIGGRDDLKALTSNFCKSSIQTWYAKETEKAADPSAPVIEPTPDDARDVNSYLADENGTQRGENNFVSRANVVDEISWKAYAFRRRVGFESRELPLSVVHEIIDEEKWSFGQSESEHEVRKMANAGVFKLPGVPNDLVMDKSLSLPSYVKFDKVLNINCLFNLDRVSLKARPPDHLIPKLRDASSDLYDKLLYAEGKGVAFENVSDYPDKWRRFLGLFAELQGLTGLEEKPINYRTSFFINLYNILHIAACAMIGPPTTSTDRSKLFSTTIKVGEHSLSMNDIEHGILRGVRFSKKDPRYGLVVPLDPRIHFTLNCGASSCPSISTYTADSLSSELLWATTAFCKSTTQISDDDKTVIVSRLFSWYRNDFVPPDSDTSVELVVLEWIFQNGLDPGSPQHKRLQNILQNNRREPGSVKVQWAPYEWVRAMPVDDEDDVSEKKQSKGNDYRSATMLKSDLFFSMRRRNEKKLASTRLVANIK